MTRRRDLVLARGRSLGAVLVDEVRKDRVAGLAAEIAFFAVLSLFPALLIAAGLLSYLEALVGAEVAARTETRVVDALGLVLTERGEPVLDSVRAVFEGEYGGLLTIAALGALVTLSGAWAVVVQALNLAYDSDEHRPWLRRRLLGLGLGLMTVLIVVVALAVVVVGPLLGRGTDVADVVGLGGAFEYFWDLARLPVLALVLVGWLALVFHLAPNRRTPWRAALPGAVATTVLWLAASGGFGLYLRTIGEGNPLLGVFGGGIVVLTWVYLLALALLLGGELNALLHDGKHRAREQGDSSASR